jgi:predicted phage tail protein
MEKQKEKIKPLTKGQKIGGWIQLIFGILMLASGIVTIILLQKAPVGGIVFFIMAIVFIYRGLKGLRIFEFSYDTKGH